MTNPPPKPSSASLAFLYCVMVGGFVAVNLFRPDVMALRFRQTVTQATAAALALLVMTAVLALFHFNDGRE